MPWSVKPAGQMFTSVGTFEMPPPRSLSEDEITGTVRDFRHAAAAAMEVGADGVEIHAANGYLIHQFLSSNANLRTDDYGGSIGNRIRFALEVAAGVVDEIGGERTGVILSPGNPLNDIVEADVDELYLTLVLGLSPLDRAYLNVVHGGDEDLIRAIRRDWRSPLVLNRRGADLETRLNDVASGLADVVTVGTQTLANPDLVERIKAGAPLNDAGRTTFYGGGERGYIDYPKIEKVLSNAESS